MTHGDKFRNYQEFTLKFEHSSLDLVGYKLYTHSDQAAYIHPYKCVYVRP
jgi:hypothetical protein